jgi:hypothetical protein
MMQTALRDRLLADATITALVGTRVDWDVRPQGKALPAITISKTELHDQHMGGPQVTRNPIVQIDCWASKPADAHTLSAAVISELQPAATVSGVRFLGAFLTETSSVEDTDNGIVHRVMVRGNIVHTIP